MEEVSLETLNNKIDSLASICYAIVKKVDDDDDDCVLSEEDIRDIKRARQERARGEVHSGKELWRELGIDVNR